MRSLGSRALFVFSLLCGVAHCELARAQAEATTATPNIVVQVVDQPDDAPAILSRIVEMVTPLGVFVRTEVSDDGGDALESLGRIVITRPDSDQEQIDVIARDGRTTTRAVPLPHGKLDEPAREAMATMCASSVQALLASPEPRQPHEPSVVPVVGAPAVAAPSPTGVASETTPQLAPAPAKQPASALGSDAARPPPRVIHDRAPEGELLFAPGYEVFAWGGGRLLHGPRVHARYARAGTGPVRFASGLEAAITLPSTAREIVFDVKLVTWSLRLLAEPEWVVSRSVALSLAAGLGLQMVTATASAAARGAHVNDTSQRLSLAFVLRPVLLVKLTRAWSLAFGAGLELHPMQLRYGLAHPDGFTSTLVSSYVRPLLSLELGYRF